MKKVPTSQALSLNNHATKILTNAGFIALACSMLALQGISKLIVKNF